MSEQDFVRVRGAHYEKKPWYWFETKKKRDERERRNIENARRLLEWRKSFNPKRMAFAAIWLLCLVGVVLLRGATPRIAILWVTIGVFLYVVLRACNPKPARVNRSNRENQDYYADRLGAGGAIAGLISGAAIGGGIGIVGGPLGAIAGTVPGAIIGCIIGLFGGRRTGASLGDRNEPTEEGSYLAKRKTPNARYGRIAGSIAGATSGATIGAGLGIAAGPLGAMAGTVPGFLVGAVIGFFLGETVGASTS